VGQGPAFNNRNIVTDRSTAGATVAAVVLAGGSGVRVGEGRNKAYLPLGGRTAVGLSLHIMATLPGLHRLVLVVRADDVELAERTLEEEVPWPPVPVELVLGGGTRHGSEDRALRHLGPAIRSAEVDLVLIHDAARPLCSRGLVAELVRVAAEHGGAVPGLASDDLAQIDADGNLVPLSGRHVRIQTPQVFAAGPLFEAYRRAAEVGFDGTDTSACVKQFSSLNVHYVPGEQQNFKITYPHDLLIANQFVRKATLHEE
jgi:2-C-methyl-D-erythritol 4-phosphate cytidylyltransferase